VAIGVNADGRRELMGLKVSDSESEPFWSGAYSAAASNSKASTGFGWWSLTPTGGPDQGRRADVSGVLLAALPRALCPQPPPDGAKGPAGDGACGTALGVRPAEPERSRRAVGSGDGHAHRQVPQGG